MKHADTRPPAPRPLALQEVSGHLTLSRQQVTAWYVLPAQPWAFQSAEQRTALTLTVANAWTALAGHDLHLRVTARPYPVSRWAGALDKATRAPVGGRAQGSPWDRALVDTQKHLQTATLGEKEVYVGVPVGGVGIVGAVADALAHRTRRFERVSGRLRDLAPPLRETVAARLHPIEQIIAGPGLAGRPVEPAEMEWLLRRSVALGLPAPSGLSPVEHGEWETDDLAAFLEGYAVERVSATVNRVYGGGVERYVTVLCMGRQDGSLTVGDGKRDPWMSHADRLPFPVEWSSRVEVLAGPDAAGKAGRKLLLARDMETQYREHNIDVPLDVARKAERARKIIDEMQEGADVESTRVHGWHRLAVSGRTEKECAERARAVRDAYRPLRMAVQQPSLGQQALLREFIPGEPLGTKAYTRRQPVTYFAAGLPTVSSTLGDRRGHYRGYTVGTTRRPVMLDPHYGPEVRERSGLVPVVGGLGSGKSTLLGAVAWDSFRSGVPTTLWDPSGPLSALVEHADKVFGPGRARHLDLMHAEPGLLSPYAIISEPLREHFATDDEWTQARAEAAAERKALALDVCLMLTSQVGQRDRTRAVLTDAARAVGGYRTAALGQVVESLRADQSGNHDHARFIADLLSDAREHPLARLYFGAGYQHGSVDRQDALLTVVTMPGLTKPDLTVPREDWSSGEIMALPLLALAIYYTSRRIYAGARRDRKFVGIDEAHFLADWPSGRALFQRLATDSRKHNAAVWAASQSASHVLGLNVANLLGAAFVGRTEDEVAARDGLRLLRVPEGVGYERVLASLSPDDARNPGRSGYREFVMRDVDGHVERMRVDLGHDPALAAVLDTTPAPAVALTKQAA